jgi:polysaccharide export outer membrane protein
VCAGFKIKRWLVMKRMFLIIIIVLFAALEVNSWAETNMTSDSLVTRAAIGDSINIVVLDNNQLNTVATVGVDGTITFPFLGHVYVKGKSTIDIEKDIVERLKEGFIKYPVVSVALNKGETRSLFTYGQIKMTGRFYFEEQLTVLEALSLRGGIIENGRYGRVKVKRIKEDGQGYREIEIDMEGLKEGAMTEEMLLQPDDILIVEKNKTFFINGEVTTPGEQVLRKDMTVERALSIAGGINENGRYGRVKVKRIKEDGQGDREIEIDMEGLKEGAMTGEMLLQPDDVLIVDKNEKFYIYGEMNKVGEFVLEKDMTAFKALTIAGGFTKWGSPDKVKILRRSKEDNDKVEIIKLDLNAIIKGMLSKDIILKPEDIIIVSSGLM